MIARFDMAHASSDGGAVLLKAIDATLGLTERLADALRDARQPGKVRHQVIELLRQRVFGVACGYADCNDAARLAHDPIHKLLVDRDPLTGAALGSQPTLSRFENGVRRVELYALGEALADTVIASHQRRLKRRRVRRITIDLDPTDDPTHGQQELAFFNGHYDNWCYLPLIGTVTFNDEPTQYLVAAVLRPGTGPTARGAIGLLRRLFAKLRAAFPRARLRVRLDGGFAGNPLLDFLEAEQVEYVIGLAGNARVEKRVRRLMGRARVLSRASGETEHLFGETRYAAKTWSHKRRV
ncbi:MAG: IS1380 family transposase, partial [Pseudomonadota bacterium]